MPHARFPVGFKQNVEEEMASKKEDAGSER
jgi:hypothetical protein